MGMANKLIILMCPVHKLPVFLSPLQMASSWDLLIEWGLSIIPYTAFLCLFHNFEEIVCFQPNLLHLL